MNSEPNLILTFPRKRRGAQSVACVVRRAVFTAASRPVSSFLIPSRSAALLQLGLVASLRAGLRSPAVAFRRCSLRVASAPAASRGVAIRSASSGLRYAGLCRSARLPNNSLVPTPVTDAPSLRVGSGAAHLKR
jgi:hypothetical protein